MANSKIIGPRNWNPVGESMWSVTAKLAKLNYMNWAEVRRLFGTKGLRSFQDEKSSNSYVAGNFNLPGLLLLTGWKIEELRSSFSSGYFPPWELVDSCYDQSVDGASTPIPCSVHLRVCYKCLEQGTHLTMHQMEDWILCPIHFEKLTTCCKYCGSSLGKIKISPLLDKGFFCPSCNKNILSFDLSTLNPDLSARKKINDEYQEWMSILKIKLDNANGEFWWLDSRRRYADLACVHQLIAGPSWVNECLINANSVRTSSFIWEEGAVHQTPGRVASRLATYYGDDNIDGRHKLIDSPPLITFLESHISRSIRKVDKKIQYEFCTHAKMGRVYELDPYLCSPGFGCSISCWPSGYWLWRRCLDAAFPTSEQWTRSTYKTLLRSSYLWDIWAAGPGSLLWSRDDGYGVVNNTKLVFWLSDLWITQHLVELYFNFVGVACREVGNEFLLTNKLENSLINLGQKPVWLIEKNNKKNVVHQLSTLASIQEFKKLHESGFHGVDEDLFSDFKALEPIIDLFHLHPKQKESWFHSWQENKKRYGMQP